jgi:hypothetical protein
MVRMVSGEREAHDMTTLRVLPGLLAVLVASTLGLSGCERAASGAPDAASAASARPPWPAYMDEFNDTVRSMERGCNDGHVKHGWGVFDTIKAPPRASAPPLLT